MPLEPLELRVVAIASSDGRTVGQAAFAERWWDMEARVLTIPGGEEGRQPVSLGIQLDDDEVHEVRVLVMEKGTDRTLKDTPPIPVKLLR